MNDTPLKPRFKQMQINQLRAIDFIVILEYDAFPLEKQ